ncbi:hypothetical protein HWV62_27482 [Athelia sp. TMB]|nr:hypothetical protein HWV62_27482 [Athelia sp. TMB]
MADNSTSVILLSRGDSIGLTLVAESAFLSLVSVLVVLGLLIRNAFRNGYLIKRPVDLFMISLFLFDLVMALGHTIDVKWVNEERLYQGGYCTAQGAIQQFGELGSSLATLAIAIHTFIGVMWGKLGKNFVFAYLVVGATWIFVILFVALGIALNTTSTEHYMTTDGYEAEQYAGEYAWLWTTMFVSLLTYSLLFLWARGNLTVSPTQWWNIRIHRALPDRVDPSAGKTRSAKMIAYPIAYATVVLPLSVVRFRSGFGAEKHHIPHAWTFAVQFLYSLSGALNVLLFLTTRSGLLLPKTTPGKSKQLWQPADEDEEKGPGMESESLRHSPLERPVSRGERPIALAALPGVEDSSDDW